MATKAASYMKNIGKSIGYSLIDEIKNNNPAITGFTNNNADVMKSTYYAVTHMKKTMSSLTEKVLDSKAGDIGRQALSNIKEDLKTGKFYNMERQQQAESAAAKEWMGGDDDFDMDFENLANGDFDMGGDDEDNVSLEDMMDIVGKKSSEAVADAVVRTTEYAVGVQTELARATADQNKAIYANIHAGMNTMNENIGKLIEVANGPLTTHMENSQKFYEEETKLSQERNDLLKQMLEIQKGIYSKEKKSSSDKITMSRIIDENGMVQLEDYFEAIKQNLNDMSGGMADMAKDLLEGGMLDAMIASPLKAITDGIVKVVMPKALKTSMKAFNKTIGGAFTSIISQLEASDSDNGIVNFIKNAFGMRDRTKTSISTSKYEKGAVPFDGIVRKSIVEVIPTYLARIESAITKTSERRYNYDTGKFMSIDQIKDASKDIRKSAIHQSSYEVNDYLNRYMRAINFDGNEKRKKSLQKNIDRVLAMSFDRGVIFNKKDFDKMPDEVGIKGKHADEDFEIIRKMFESLPREVIMSYAQNMYHAKESMTRDMERREESGHDIINALHNNSIDKATMKQMEEMAKRKKKEKKGESGSIQETVASGKESKTKGKKNKKDKGKSDDDDSSSIRHASTVSEDAARILSDGTIILSDEAADELISQAEKNLSLSNSVNKERSANTGSDGTIIINESDLEEIIKRAMTDRPTNDPIAKPLSDGTVIYGADDVENILRDIKDQIETQSTSEEKEEKKDNRVTIDFDDLESSLEDIAKRFEEANTSEEDLELARKAREKEKERRKKKGIEDPEQDKLDELEGAKYKAKSLLQRIRESGKLGEGMNKFVGGLDKLLHKPTELLTGFIEKADKAVYNMIFGVEYDEEGEKKSVAAAIFDGLKEEFSHFREWMDNKILDPMKKYFDKEGTLGNKVKKYFGGKWDKFKESEFGSRFFKTTSGAADYVKGTVTDAAKVVKNAANEGLGADTDESTTADALKSNAADGIKKINKTGVMAVSAGEMVIPPDLNPFNIEQRTKKENAAKRKFAQAFADNIPGFAEGTLNTDPEVMKRISDNWVKKNKENPEAAKAEFDKLPEDVQQNILKALKGEHSNKVADKIHEKISGIESLIGNAINRGRGKKDDNKEAKKEEDSLVKATAKEVKKFAPEVAAGSLIGTGLLGLITGPLIGAAIGGGMSLLKHSESLNEKLFGEIAQEGEEKGKRQGGLFSKEISQAIQKYGSAMLKGATLGAITSLIPFVPGGPVTGILVGSALGFASQNDEIKEKLFGEDSLFGKNFDTRLKKALPAIGGGAALGLLAGPFGAVPNMMLGSALGWVSTTDRFKDMLFGAKDQDGKREGGFVEKAIKNTFVPLADYIKTTVKDLTDWTIKNIKQPLVDAIDPLKKQLGLIGKSIMTGINKLFEEKLGATLDTMVHDYVLKPIGGFLKKAMGFMLFPIKTIAKAPFSLIGAAGNALRHRQVNRGNAEYMSADQRLEFRNERGLLHNLGLRKTDRKWKKYDKAFSNMSGEEAEDLASKLGFALNQEKEMNKSTKDAYNKFDQKIRGNSKLSAGQINGIAKRIQDAVKDDGDIDKASRKAHEFIARLRGISETEKTQLSEVVDEYLASIKELRGRKEKFGNNKQKLMDALRESQTFQDAGIKDIDEKDLPKLLNYLKAEAKYKTVDEKTGEAKHSDKLVGDLPSLDERQQKRHEETIDKLDEIVKKMAALVNPNLDKRSDNYNKLRDNWDEDKENGEFIGAIRDALIGAGMSATDAAKWLAGGTVEGTNSILRGLFGRNSNTMNWRNPGEGEVKNAASGMKRVSKTGVIAVSEGEMIVPPDLNPFNIAARKKKEDEAKKKFVDAIPGFAGGGIINDDSDIIDTTSGDGDTESKKATFFDRIKDNLYEKKERFKYVFDQAGRKFKYRIDPDGEMKLDKSDSDTSDSIVDAEREKQEKKNLTSKILDFPGSIASKIGDLFHGKDKDKDKQGILGKIFSIFGGGKSPLKGLIGKAISLAIGGPLLIGVLKDKVWPHIQPFIEGIAPGVGNFVTSLKDKLINWFQGTGESIGKGFPNLLQAGVEHWASGLEFTMTKIIPKALEIVIKALPTIVMSGAKAVGALLLESLNNIRFAGRPSTKVQDSVSKQIASGTIVSIPKLLSSGNQPLSQYTGTTTDWSKYYSGWDAQNTIDISAPDIQFDNRVMTDQVNSAQSLTEAEATKANAAYITKSADPSYSGYDKQDSYKNLNHALQVKVDEQIKNRTGENTNVYKVGDKTLTLQEILASDETMFTMQDPNTGQLVEVKGKDVLNYPELAQNLGIDMQLTEAERQAEEERLGINIDHSIGSEVGKLAFKKFMRGDTGATVVGKTGKFLSKHGGVISKIAGATLQGADNFVGKAGKLGQKVVPSFMRNGSKTIEKYAADIAADKVEDGVEKVIKNSAGEAVTRSGIILPGRAGTEMLAEEAAKRSAKEAAEKATKEAAEKAAKEGAETMAEKAAKVAAEGNKGIISKAMKFIKSKIAGLFGDSQISRILSKSMKESGKEATEKAVKKYTKELTEKITTKLTKIVGEKLAKAGGKVLAKIGATIASAGAFEVITVVAAFISGYNNANSIIGVVDEIYEPDGMTKFLCGLVNAINELVAFGLIPLDMLFDFLLPIVSTVFKVDTSELEQARIDSAELVEKYNEDNGVDLNVEEYNKKDSITTHIKNGIKKIFSENGNTTSKAQDAGLVPKDDKKKKDDKKSNKVPSISGATSEFANSSSGGSNKKTPSISGATSEFANVSTTVPSVYLETSSGGTLEDTAYSPEFATADGSAPTEYIDDSGTYLADTYSAVEPPVTEILQDGKKMSSTIKSAVSKAIMNAKNAKSGDFFNAPKSKENDPYSWIELVVTGATRYMLSPILFTATATKGIQSSVKSILSKGKSLLSSISKDVKTVSKYTEKKDTKKYWDIKNNTGIFGPLETIMMSVNRMIQYPFVLISQMTSDISDNIKKVKESTTKEVDKAAKSTSEFANASGSGFHGRGSGVQSDPKYKDDPSFVSQLDKRYANKSFNVTGDSQRQTIADTGCGPAAAAMVVNNAYQDNQLNMKDAAKDALKYKVKDGGVNAAYFENEFTKHGLNTKYIMDDNQSERNSNIIQNLQYGHRTVLMGQDLGNNSKANSPYGPNDHYIVATRISPDNKYIWVNDPESNTPEVKYPAEAILNNTKMGVTGIAASGTGLLRKINARGSSLKSRLKALHGRGKYGPDTVQYKVWVALKGAGYNDIASAAAMGNIQCESGFDPSTIEKGSGIGFGLIQWSKTRRVAYENYAKSKGKSPSDLATQIEYMLQELQANSGIWTKANGSYGFGTLTRDDWANGKDIDTATKAFMCCFERPAYSSSVNHIDRRLAAAKEYLQEFAGVTADASSTGSSSGDDSSSQSGGILSDILGVFDDFAVAYGLKSKSSSSDGSSSSSGGVSGGSDKQQALVQKMKSVEGKLQYSQEGPRNPDKGSADCSSTVQWAYKNVLGVDPGNTTYQMQNDPDTYQVTTSLDESQMQPGDMILYNGHVEMYAGDGQMIGHGDGMGPTTKKISSLNGRFTQVRRWVGFKDAAASGSGLPGYAGRATGLDPDKELKISDTTRNFRYSDNNGFLRKSRYKNDLKKDVKIDASTYAAGSDIDEIVEQDNYKAPSNIPVTPAKKTDTTKDKLLAYLDNIRKLLVKEVENTSMLSTIVTILTELVKTYEEERAIDSKSPDAVSKKEMLESKRMSMMNILKATGVGGGNANNELTKLIADAERLARI